MDPALTKLKIRELHRVVGDDDRIAIVLQDDPDPDAMASAIALRTLLGRHPGYETGLAAFEDVRVDYGATSTILTEYLLTADEHISERLATALLYGIRSDTLDLSRRATEADLKAFTHLYPLVNYNVLRQIDRAELPLSFARMLSRAMSRLIVRDGLAVLHLGKVERDDLIVQMAEFCLQFEGVDWVGVSGKLGTNLVVAIRHHGLGRANAGELAKQIFGDLGSAGGHRNMAKAVVPLRQWREREGSTRDKDVETRLRELFADAIFGQAETMDGRPIPLRNGD